MADVVVLVVVACKSSVLWRLLGLGDLYLSPNTGEGGGVMLSLRKKTKYVNQTHNVTTSNLLYSAK